ncbi:unnamed protein product [Lactuca virosa]|uniref:Uncharacterized protein n=1 Tax=Lactuca virosa TaxID=75947 RepID=A0AAU9P4J1_9ASTR|nr:unnamed protein product [Lactuca virosa]
MIDVPGTCEYVMVSRERSGFILNIIDTSGIVEGGYVNDQALDLIKSRAIDNFLSENQLATVNYHGEVATSISFFSPGQTSSSKTQPPQKKATSSSDSKHSGSSRILRQGKQKHRLHPGLLSSQDRATAHYGAVMGLKAIEDGMYLLSADSVMPVSYFVEYVLGSD